MRVSFSIAAAGALALFATSAGAAADEKQVCVQAFEDAQQLRIDGKLRAARDRLLVCSNERCPAPVRRDCVQWTTEVMAAIPTVVFGARDPRGRDVAAVRVRVDGVAVVERLDGEPVPIDPGPHVFRFEPGNAAPVEQQAIVRAGEKNREISVTLAAPAVGSSPPAPTASPSPPPPVTDAPPAPPADQPAAAAGSRGPSALAWIFGGVGVAALGASLALELSVKSDADGLRASCGAAGCTPGQVDPLKTRQALAGVALGVGLAALGTSAVFFFVRPTTSQGAVAGLGERF